MSRLNSSSSKTYTVTLIHEELGSRTSIRVRDNEYILDAAEVQGVQLPYSCRTGACTVCTGRMVEGSLDQSGHSFLKDKELKAGFALLCAAKPTSDCEIKIHQEDALYNL